MKKIAKRIRQILFLLIAINIVSCQPNSQPNFQSNISVLIDTVKVIEKEFKNNCFKIENSYYPKIKGLNDSLFQIRLNKIFQDNFNSFSDFVKFQSTCGDEKSILGDVPSTARSWFKIFTKSDSIISIVQEFCFGFGGGGNGFELESIVINANLKKNIILSNYDLNIYSKNRDYYLLKIKNYLNVLDQSYKSKLDHYWRYTDLKSLNIGIRNDSLILVIEEMPSCHANHDLYEIPLDKYSNFIK